MSIFPSNSGSHGRISPQDIQGLLELSRLNVAEGKRRTLSPDSRLSSRSSSPPSSSGRASPCMLRFFQSTHCFLYDFQLLLVQLGISL